MLVLSRKVGEKIVIGDNITVEVVRVSGNRVSLGLVAPSDVKIRRGELTPLKVDTTETEAVAEQSGLRHAS